MVGFCAFVVLSGVILGILGVVGFGAFLALPGAIFGILGTVGFGAFVALSGVTAGILGAVGSGPGGVAASQYFPYYSKVLPLPVTY